MSRLIDADALIEAIRKSTCHWPERMWKQVVCDVIHNQPTAYDVESVVAELENEKFCIEGCRYYVDLNTTINDAIEIVKRGGAER